ncbi:hypothetical protein HY229_05800 [Candidatus Acetothermia bacterium]|nr:hypothetical protein [Candidatus Acetothermia bacterium]MBI3643596.1 hypothetical protein [Candidatus Acetothermia bacterium]
MKRLYILYTQDRQSQLVARLQKLGLLHLEESKLDQEQPSPLEVGPLAKDRRDVENSLIKARGVIDLFQEVDPTLLDAVLAEHPTAQTLGELSAEFRKEIEALEGKLKKLVGERRELRDRQNAGALLREVIEASESLLRELPRNENSIVAMIGSPKDSKKAIEEIRSTISSPLSGRFTLISQELMDKRVVLLVSVQAEYAALVEQYIREKGFAPVALPQHVQPDFIRGIAQLKTEETTLPTRLQELDRELMDLAQKHASRVYVLATALENRMGQLEVANRFGYTDYTLLITGWVPADEMKDLQQTLIKEFSGIVVEEDRGHHDHDEIPIALRERKHASSYKLFLDAFGVPKHGAVDPVPYISIFFPIFFGIIVGDIGYGLVVLSLAIWGLTGFPGLKGRGPKKFSASEGGQGALKVMRDGAIMSILFGFLFGEIFGLEFKNLGVHPVGLWPFSRVDNPIDLLNFMIVVGVIQVTLGFAFGVVTALRHHNKKEFLVKIGLFLALIGFACIVGNLMHINDHNFLHLKVVLVAGSSVLLFGVVLLAVAIVILAIGGGVIALVEALSPFIHVLSYARVMGFALAGAVLASLVNQLSNTLAGDMHSVSIGLILRLLIAALVGLTLHMVNLGLHVFEGSIQSARLHWVEFFGKFILEHLGGKPYQPFKEKQLSDL